MYLHRLALMLLFCSAFVVRSKDDPTEGAIEPSEPSPAAAKASKADSPGAVPASEDIDLVGLNPDYEAPDDGDDGSEYDDEYDYETDDDEEDSFVFDVKPVLSKVLKKTRGQSVVKTMKLIKKNKGKITLALALFAFRKELGQLLLRLITTPTKVDPKTGRVLSRSLNLSPTSVLKIILFLDFMRRMQKGGSNPGAMFPAGPQAMFLAPLLSRLMSPMHSAYVPPIEQHWTFERINDRYDRDALAFLKVTKPTKSAPGGNASSLEGLQGEKATFKTPNSAKPDNRETVILLDWTKLTQSLTQMSILSDQISFLLSLIRSRDSAILAANGLNTTNATSVGNATGPQIEVIVVLESPGGSAADYGLAAQQILRLRNEPGITLTVCVDKVAASGGYMIAVCSSPGHLFAAPFAVVGSIGVIGSSINIHRVLQGWGVRPLVFRGGKDKAPVGLIGEVTREGVAKVQAMVDSTHDAFKRHVVSARPALHGNIETIATGDIWLGIDAVNVGLVDRIVSSDEYVGERLRDGARVLKMLKYERSRIHFPPFPSGRSLSNSWSAATQSLKSILIDLPQVITKLTKLLDDHQSSVLADDQELSAVAKTLSATSVQATSNI